MLNVEPKKHKVVNCQCSVNLPQRRGVLIKCFFVAQTNAKMGTNCWTTVCFLNVLSRNYSWRLLPHISKAARRIGFIISPDNRGKVNHNHHHHKDSEKRSYTFLVPPNDLKPKIVESSPQGWQLFVLEIIPGIIDTRLIQFFMPSCAYEKLMKHKLYRMKYDSMTIEQILKRSWTNDLPRMSVESQAYILIHFEPLSYFKDAIIL